MIVIDSAYKEVSHFDASSVPVNGEKDSWIIIDIRSRIKKDE